MTRSNRKLMRDLAAAHRRKYSGDSKVYIMSEKFVTEYAWSDITIATSN